MKLCFMDVETTGTDPKVHAVIQVAGIILSKGHEQEFTFNLKPFKGDLISKYALDVNRLSIEKLETFEEPKKIYGALTNIFRTYVDPYNKGDKMFFVGYRADFDYNFMRAFWEKNDDKYFGSYFWYPPIDLMPICAIRMMADRPRMPNFKLGTVANALGLGYREEDAHNALYDVKITRALYEVMRQV